MPGRTVKLYELCTAEDKRGLNVETIPWRFTEKDRIKFAGSKQVPVLIDGDKVLKDSFDIALYLEKAYPDGPTLFGSKEGEAAARYADNYAIWAFGELYPAIILDEWKKLDKVDAEYFRESRESMFGGKKLEDLAAHPEENIQAFRKALHPLRMTLEHQHFVGGDVPLYADYAMAASMLSSRAISQLQLLEKDDPVLAWFKRILAKYEDNLEKAVFDWQLP